MLKEFFSDIKLFTVGDKRQKHFAAIVCNQTVLIYELVPKEKDSIAALDQVRTT